MAAIDHYSPTQNAVIAGHSLIVHNVADHTAVTWTLTSSPSNTWVQIGGCGVSDYFCDWIAWSAASGVTTFTVPAASWQTLYQEVSGIASLRHSVYSAPATGSTQYTTGTVSATAGDYLLAFDSCQGGFTGLHPVWPEQREHMDTEKRWGMDRQHRQPGI